MSDELVLTFPRRLLDEIGSFQDCAPTSARSPAHRQAENTRYVARCSRRPIRH